MCYIDLEEYNINTIIFLYFHRHELNMEIESHMHPASEICSTPAKIETLDSYEDAISHYQSKDFTYIPMPKDGKYYNTEEGWIRDIQSTQIVDQETHLMEVLRRMSNYPFILVDFAEQKQFYEIEIDGDIDLFPEGMIEFADTNEIELNFDGGSVTGEELVEEKEESDPLTVHDVQEEYPEQVGDLVPPYDEQYGIITLVDINKRGIKQMLYKIISQLSSDLATKIESQHPESEDIFKHMRPITIGRWRKDKLNGLNMHISEHMNLLEMMQVIQASDESFVEKCGFDSKDDVTTLNKINDIRNRVMHANRSLIYERKEIEEILDVIDEAERILNNLSD